jgi:hypothetical protein
MCIGSTNHKHGSIQESSLLWEVLSIGLVDFEYLIKGDMSHRFLVGILLTRKVFCFVVFCFFKWRSPKPQHPCHILVTIGKLLMSRDALRWFHNDSTYGAGVIEY